MSYRSPSTLAAAFRACVVLCGVPALANAVTWDGGGTANSSGTWETGANWNPDGVPLSSDAVILDNVTSGTRTVTVSSGSPQTVSSLTLTQTTVGAVNKLSVLDNLTISGAGNPLITTATAGSGSVVIDVAAGKTLQATRVGAALSTTYAGTINLLGTGSAFKLASSSSTATATVSGSITAAAGSVFRTTGTNATLTHSGVSSFGTGATITLDYTGSAIFNNSGTFTQDGAKFVYEWNATTGGNGTRNYNNTGTWTLKNGASVVIETTTGMQTTGGFGTLVGNTNAGTLNLESGSTLTSRSFTNTGTLNLGSTTSGTSDATVTLGALINSDIILTNGSATTAGTVNIRGNALFGRTTPSSSLTAIFNNGAADSTGSLLDIGDGTTAITFTIGNSNASLQNFSGNTVRIRSNATLLLASVQNTAVNGNATFTNSGSFIQSGKLQFRSNQSGGTRIFTTSGSHKISGTGAVIESLANSNNGTATAIAYTNTGLLGGSSAADKLTYTNTSGNVANGVLTMAVAGGQFAPGNGSNGSGATSVGSLGFENINLTFSGNSTLTFDIGGTAGSGLFDSVVFTGNGGVFTLGGSETLDIRLVNGFSSVGGTYTLVDATSVMGTFGSLLFNGAAVGDAYTIIYGTDSISITFAAVPEPGTAALWLGMVAAGAVAVMRRKRC